MASKIKVDNIENQCGGAVVTKCGATTTISGSVVKADDIQAADGGNIINQCGTTITLGASGDTISLASGASQTGFGRTGTVDWDTTAKTASFTAVSGNGYFVNTTSGAITLTLPASPSAGDIVAFKDYAFTFATNNLTVNGNGSPIGGVDGTINPTYDTNGTSKTFIYVDGTKGWLVVNESTDTSQESTAEYITATGGTITTSGDFKIHTFTGPGTFTVCSVGNPAGSNSVDYLVTAGGGGGGGAQAFSCAAGGGGGAGGFRESSGAASGCYTASPLGACVSALPVAVQGYPITVGAGGGIAAPGDGAGTNGSNSIFSTITSAGGGGGGGYSGQAAGNGGSGGGCGGGGVAGNGNTPPVSPPQGTNGGSGGGEGGGGGGATVAGQSDSGGQDGGAGATSSINGTPTARAGGGGGGTGAFPGGTGGAGGGASAGPTAGPSPSGTTNTGGGGGGGPTGDSTTGGSGGSGIVIIRYKFQ
jgi:hypothetical protein